jgi:soluble lytic murein transglycosylase
MNKFKTTFKTISIIIIACVLLYFYTKLLIYKNSYVDYIEDICAGSSVDPYLILSIIKVESGFNSSATSIKDAKGLMQVKDTTYSDVADVYPIDGGKIDLYDPEINIRVGVEYFKKLVNRYNGNYYIALLAYNAGIGNVNTWINSGIVPKNLDESIVPDIPFKETKDYLRKVIFTYNVYKFLYNL